MATEVPGNKAHFTLGEIAALTGGELLPGSWPAWGGRGNVICLQKKQFVRLLESLFYGK